MYSIFECLNSRDTLANFVLAHQFLDYLREFGALLTFGRSKARFYRKTAMSLALHVCGNPTR